MYLETITMQFLGIWPHFDGVYLLRGESSNLLFIYRLVS